MRLSSRLFCLLILALLSISATVHAGTMAITAVGPSSYIRPSIENNYVQYRYQIINELGQDLYLSSVAAGSGDLKNVSIDDGRCSFYNKDSAATTPLTPGASCDVFCASTAANISDRSNTANSLKHHHGE